ncbi:hypothetical protein HY285_02640 [Candidatus Peregrinibacteria bacterium]|nr:hypothetical protein [Candidatus Peregrinibacteria bacterium]MBI3816418.1 hypothetical protein [Candidatus Peregrinibacteria bacterium]
MRLRSPLVIVVSSFASATQALAQVYTGPGLQGGVSQAQQIEGPAQVPIRDLIIRILNNVLTFLGLAAVIAIIVAGIYLIVSGGSEDAKTKARKIILYTVVGLIIVLLAKLIVSFVITTITGGGT